MHRSIDVCLSTHRPSTVKGAAVQGNMTLPTAPGEYLGIPAELHFLQLQGLT